jgi:hypothetical protein
VGLDITIVGGDIVIITIAAIKATIVVGIIMVRVVNAVFFADILSTSKEEYYIKDF